jgi:hypothetical protein
MASKTIAHPLRTIQLTYNELTPFHPAEEAMLDRYTSLHNFVKELCEEYAHVQQQYEDHDADIKRVIARYRAIKTRMHSLNAAAKSAIGKMVPDITEVEKIIADGKAFKILLASFNKDVEQLAAESAVMHEIFTPLDTKDGQLAEIFKEYRTFRGQVAGTPANYSLDFEQYDTDEQAFLGSLNDMSVRQNRFIAICNAVIDRYNLLVEEVEKTFTQWEQCNQMLGMLQLMRTRPHDITQICLN